MCAVRGFFLFFFPAAPSPAPHPSSPPHTQPNPQTHLCPHLPPYPPRGAALIFFFFFFFFLNATLVSVCCFYANWDLWLMEIAQSSRPSFCTLFFFFFADRVALLGIGSLGLLALWKLSPPPLLFRVDAPRVRTRGRVSLGVGLPGTFFPAHPATVAPGATGVIAYLLSTPQVLVPPEISTRVFLPDLLPEADPSFIPPTYLFPPPNPWVAQALCCFTALAKPPLTRTGVVAFTRQLPTPPGYPFADLAPHLQQGTPPGLPPTTLLMGASETVFTSAIFHSFSFFVKSISTTFISSCRGCRRSFL